MSWLTGPANQHNFHNFHVEFPVVFERKELEWKCAELEHTINTEGMSLYPEYQRRLQVLKDLRYCRKPVGRYLCMFYFLNNFFFFFQIYRFSKPCRYKRPSGM